MKVSSLLFVGFLGAVSAVAAESEACAEYDWFPEYNDTEYWGLAPKADVVQQISVVRPKIDVTSYYLFYEKLDFHEIHYNRPDELSNSKFDKKLPTVFLIYDWDQECRSGFIVSVRGALWKSGKYNIFCVDWSYYTARPYNIARAYVEDVGKYVARFIDFLKSQTGISFNALTLIGYGLGAHVAGHAGKNVKKGKIDMIIGLDPARLGFDFKNCTERLCSTDAKYVESVQTNGGYMYERGFNEPLGTATFYPDYGKYQLPCFGSGGFACSHYMSYIYYAIAIEMNNFCASKCKNYEQVETLQCSDVDSRVKMGFPKENKSPGIYYVPILRAYPYGGCSLLKG